MTKEEHLKELGGREKAIEGKEGSDAWWHFDALYEDESGEGTEDLLLRLIRWVG